MKKMKETSGKIEEIMVKYEKIMLTKFQTNSE